MAADCRRLGRRLRGDRRFIQSNDQHILLEELELNRCCRSDVQLWSGWSRMDAACGGLEQRRPCNGRTLQSGNVDILPEEHELSRRCRSGVQLWSDRTGLETARGRLGRNVILVDFLG